MKPSDEQLREIGHSVAEAARGTNVFTYESQLKMGRAAFEASCKIALAEPTPQERARFRADIVQNSGGLGLLGDVPLANFIGYRLRSLTEPEKDEAVEAVKGINLAGRVSSVREDEMHIRLHDTLAAEIVAAVDKARGSK